MPIRRLVHAYYPTFNPPLLYVRTITLTHALTCRQMQAFNLPFVTRTYTRMHPHIDKAFKKGVRIWEGMVLCIRPSLAIGIHRGTLVHTLGLPIRVCGGGGGGGGGGGVYIHRAMCMCVW